MTNITLSKIREELLAGLSGYAKDFAIDCEDNFASYVSSREYISDMVSQFADNNVDIYYSDLLAFVKEDPDSLDEVIQEGIYDPSVDYRFFDHVRAAQWLSIEREIQDKLGEIIRYLAVSYLWRMSEKDYTEEEISDLDAYLDPYPMSTFDEIAKDVDNFVAGV